MFINFFLLKADNEYLIEISGMISNEAINKLILVTNIGRMIKVGGNEGYPFTY
jgi:hypothetical protein